jgi:signal transduction histidine kinase
MRRALAAYVDRRRALPIAVALALLAGLGDYVTTAETVFTLFYLVPIGIAVWFRSPRAGAFVMIICIILSLLVDTTLSTVRVNYVFVAWNSLVEVGLFILFGFLIDLLRKKLATEAELRKEALKQLRHADRLTTVGRLAAGLAHELGTPLNIVSGKASLISAGRVEGENLKTSAHAIEQQADRMAALVRQLLDFARKGGAARQKTNIRLLSLETANLLRPLANNSGVAIHCEGDDVECSINRAEMLQVLSNLVTNAIHAMPHGGRVTLTSTLEGGAVVLRVKDEGEGIEAHILPRIFDPFFTTKEVGAGTGLGLSVAHGIVADHGGTIEVESEHGHGATFTLTLPL